MKEFEQQGCSHLRTFFEYNSYFFRISQLELKQCIESLSEELKKVQETLQTTVDLDVYVKKLINAKQRVTVIANILQNAQDRLNKVHMSIDKETVKRKIILNNVIDESSPSSSQQ